MRKKDPDRSETERTHQRHTNYKTRRLLSLLQRSTQQTACNTKSISASIYRKVSIATSPRLLPHPDFLRTPENKLQGLLIQTNPRLLPHPPNSADPKKV